METSGSSGAAAFGYSHLKTLVMALILGVLTLFPLGAALNAQADFGFVLLLGMTATFCGLWLMAMLARLFWRGPVLIVSRDGFLDRRIGPKTIPWERVVQVYVFKARQQIFLAVIPDDPADFIDPPGRLQRLALWVNDALRLPRFSVSLMGLDASQRTIMQALRRHVPAGLVTDADRVSGGL